MTRENHAPAIAVVLGANCAPLGRERHIVSNHVRILQDDIGAASVLAAVIALGDIICSER